MMARFFIQTMAAGLLLVSCGSFPGNNEPLRMLVGTYTDNNDSGGVYLYEFDESSLEFTFIDTARVGNPSFVIPSSDRKYAYGVSEYDDGREGACAFRMDDSSIDLINVVSTDPAGVGTGGGAPCNVIIVGGNLITSNYSGGTLSCFPIKDDGGLGPLSQIFVPEEGPAHNMHCAVLSPDGKYLFANDLGADVIYRFDVFDGNVDFSNAQVAFSLVCGTHPGPRHSVFSDDGRFLYLLGELGDVLYVFACSDGELSLLSSCPAYDGGGHGSADIHISPDGRFIYTSHRLKQDGISIFKADTAGGSVEKVGFCATGIHPRNFSLTPDGRYLLCACRDDNRIDVFSVDSETGLLKTTGRSLEIPAPVCIQLFR